MATAMKRRVATKFLRNKTINIRNFGDKYFLRETLFKFAFTHQKM